jgi:hypothetical protein
MPLPLLAIIIMPSPHAVSTNDLLGAVILAIVMVCAVEVAGGSPVAESLICDVARVILSFLSAGCYSSCNNMPADMMQP